MSAKHALQDPHCATGSAVVGASVGGAAVVGASVDGAAVVDASVDGASVLDEVEEGTSVDDIAVVGASVDGAGVVDDSEDGATVEAEASQTASTTNSAPLHLVPTGTGFTKAAPLAHWYHQSPHSSRHWTDSDDTPAHCTSVLAEPEAPLQYS